MIFTDYLHFFFKLTTDSVSIPSEACASIRNKIRLTLVGKTLIIVYSVYYNRQNINFLNEKPGHSSTHFSYSVQQCIKTPNHLVSCLQLIYIRNFKEIITHTLRLCLLITHTKLEVLFIFFSQIDNHYVNFSLNAEDEDD